MQTLYHAGPITKAELEQEQFLQAEVYKKKTPNGPIWGLWTDLLFADVPSEGLTITSVVQRTRDKHGYIRVRWGELGEVGSGSAEFGEGGVETM